MKKTKACCLSQAYMEVSHKADKKHSGESNMRKKKVKNPKVLHKTYKTLSSIKKKTKKERDLKKKVTPI